MQLTRPRQLLILLLLAASALLSLIIQPAEQPALRSLALSPVLVDVVSRTNLDPASWCPVVCNRYGGPGCVLKSTAGWPSTGLNQDSQSPRGMFC